LSPQEIIKIKRIEIITEYIFLNFNMLQVYDKFVLVFETNIIFI